MDGYIGTIIMFAGYFAPQGWMLCQGQILPIAENTALFSLLGTTYGGDGETNFALPDLRSRVPVGTGQGAGLSKVSVGQMAGTEAVALTESNLPAHSHTAQITSLSIPVDASQGENDIMSPSLTKN